MISPAEATRPLHCQQISGISHNAENAVVSGGVAAQWTHIGISVVETHSTLADALLDFADRFREGRCVLSAGVKQMKGETLRRLGADARQLLKFLYESGE